MAGKQRESCLFSALKLIFVHLIVRVLFSIVLIVFALAVAFYVLGIGAPTSYPAPKVDAGDTSSMANIITRLARSLVDKEGRVVDTAVLKLSQDEVQTLIDAVIAKSTKLETLSLPYSAAWDDGHLQVKYSMPVSSGKAANLDFEVSPVVKNGNLSLIPDGGSVGSLPMPDFALRKAANKLVKLAMQDESLRTALSAFTRIEPGDDGTLLLMFDPRNVNTVVRVLKSAGELSNEEPDRDDDSGDDRNEEDEEIIF